MNLARHLTLALSAVSLVASPVLAQAADASGSATPRQGAAMGDSDAIAESLLNDGMFVIPLIAVFALILAFTVSDGGNSEEPTSP